MSRRMSAAIKEKKGGHGAYKSANPRLRESGMGHTSVTSPGVMGA